MEDPVQQYQGWKPHQRLMASDIIHIQIHSITVFADNLYENGIFVPFYDPAAH